jgi:hypothetical protein
MKLPSQSIVKTKHSKFDFTTIDLHQNNFSIYKLTSLYDIIDCLNCIEYKYYKNTITNKTLDSLETSFLDITNMFKNANIQYKPIFIDDLLDVNEYQRGMTNIYFTYHKHVIEKKTDELEESLEYNNWYIIMYHDQILFDLSNYNLNETETPISENETETPISANETEQDDKIRREVIDEYTLLKNNGGKITIKVLKDLLQRLNIKSSGKKEELQARIEDIINANAN